MQYFDKGKIIRWFIVMILCLFFSHSAVAAENLLRASSSAKSADLALKGEDEKSPNLKASVTDISSDARKANDGAVEAGLGNEITLTVENLEMLVKKAKEANKKIILFIDNIAIKGIESFSIDISSGKIVYRLYRTDESKAAWTSLLGKPTKFVKSVPVSIGIENEAIESSVKFNLILLREFSTLAWFAAACFLIGLIGYLSIKTPILRAADIESPYSLGKTQMAIWTCVVIISYLFIWIAVRDFNSINGTAFILMGISTATALGAVFVDSSKENSKTQLTAQSNALKMTISDLQTKISEIPADKCDQLIQFQQDINEKVMQKAIFDQKIANYPINSGKKPLGFLGDILKDGDGWSLHRVQMLFWTIILVGIFISNVYSNLSMPDFDTTLLALMGISSGTYLGFKFPERN